MILQKQQQLQWLEEMDRRQALTADEKKDLNYRQIGFAGASVFGRNRPTTVQAAHTQTLKPKVSFTTFMTIL